MTSKTARPLRVVSYNIHRCVGNDGVESVERIGAVLREMSADIIALQEVGTGLGRAADVAQTLAAAVDYHLTSGVTLTDSRGDYGNALLTRVPPGSVQRHDISVRGREPRGIIEARLHWNEQPVQVMATHLGLRPRERQRQIERLLSLRETDPDTLKILLGDFNEWYPFSSLLRRLARAFGPMAAPATFPARRPLLSLDRLWVHPVSALRRLTVHRSATARVASDHLPLVAELLTPLPATRG